MLSLPMHPYVHPYCILRFVWFQGEPSGRLHASYTCNAHVCRALKANFVTAGAKIAVIATVSPTSTDTEHSLGVCPPRVERLPRKRVAWKGIGDCGALGCIGANRGVCGVGLSLLDGVFL